MPGPKKKSARSTRFGPSAARSTLKSHGRALLVIDNAPLQRAAWAEFHTAQKRHDKAARDLHRHEQIDVPSYEAWLHRTFPVMITTLRELHEEVYSKSQRVQHVQAMAALSGRSPKKLWREQKEAEANPDFFEESFDDSRSEEAQYGRNQQGSANNDSFRGAGGFDDAEGFFGRDFEPAHPHQNPAFTREAKSIYRRLVQYLHPDRGGEFTPVRKRLWHEVQQAWTARDVDWLSRIEIEWETANEVLGPTSPVGRLRRAIEELHAARRDTERKLREYRRSFPWRFTLNEAKRRSLHRKAEASFEHDIAYLQRQLDYLKSIIAAWENTRPRRARSQFADW